MADDLANNGYASPPQATRFKKGQSGNPKGRPRGSKNAKAPYESVLGQLVTVRTDGAERKITAAEAFLLHMTRRGLSGDASAARSTLDAIEALPQRTKADKGNVSQIILNLVSPASSHHMIEEFACSLNMAVMLDPYRETAHLAVQPWLVEEALARLDDRRLSPEDQKVVWHGVRTPWKINWPEWWVYKG